MSCKINRIFTAFFFYILISSASIASEQNNNPHLHIASIFSDNMVLQRDSIIPVWGTAKPGNSIKIQIAGQTKAAIADANGNWQIRLDPIKVQSSLEMLVSDSENTVKFKNVAVGEVWIASGQSNMQWSLAASETSSRKGAANNQIDLAGASFPDIRLFFVNRSVADKPQPDCNGHWEICSPETVKKYSAVGYYFARDLHTTLKVPVGLIHSCWGGTQIESWIPQEILETDADFQPILKRYKENCENYPIEKEKWGKQINQWEILAEEAKKNNNPVPAKPKEPEPWGPNHYRSPYKLFNAMISPLIPYRIRGAIWYQGESNVSRGYQYRKLFPAMISTWRKKWSQGDFPFYYVQLPPYKYPQEYTAAELREAQLLALKIPNTGMAVTMDIGEVNNIHPRIKEPVGKRLALWAFAKIYGFEDIVYSGPIYKNAIVQGGKIKINFDYTGSGLIVKGNCLTDFEIAGADRKYFVAKAEIDGNSVIVYNPQVNQPEAVRYAWSNTAQPDLFNEEGLPASPFRTDDWPGVTANER